MSIRTYAIVVSAIVGIIAATVFAVYKAHPEIFDFIKVHKAQEVTPSTDDRRASVTAASQQKSVTANGQQQSVASASQQKSVTPNEQQTQRLIDCEEQLTLSGVQQEGTPLPEGQGRCLAEVAPPPKDPYYSIVPIQLFGIAGLGEHNNNQVYGQLKEVSPDIFVEGSVALNGRETFVGLLAKNMFDTCVKPNPDATLAVEVFGFSSDEPFRTLTGQKRQDSELLNLAVANLRGKAVYDALAQAIPAGTNMTVHHHEWQDREGDPRCRSEPANEVREALCKMRKKRDDIFDNFQIAQGRHTNHRSAIIRVSNPQKCSLLYPY